MRPIQTWYDGILFESLLEARWAVFFNTAGIPYEYEYVGHKLGELGKTWYLPDFWLPEQNTWIEVKPHSDFQAQDLKKITHFEQALWDNGIISTTLEGKSRMKHFYVVVGSPYFNGTRHAYKIFNNSTETIDLPAAQMKFVDTDMRWMHCPLCDRLSIGDRFFQLRDVYDEVVREELMCPYCSIEDRREGENKSHDDYRTWCSISVYTTRSGYILGSPRLMRAYATARRFKAPRKRS